MNHSDVATQVNSLSPKRQNAIVNETNPQNKFLEGESVNSGPTSRTNRSSSDAPSAGAIKGSHQGDAATSSTTSPCRIDGATHCDLSSTTAASPYRSLPATPSYALQYSSSYCYSISLSRNKLRTVSSPSLRFLSHESECDSSITTEFIGIPFPLSTHPDSTSTNSFNLNHLNPLEHVTDSYYRVVNGKNPTFTTFTYSNPQQHVPIATDSAPNSSVTIETSIREKEEQSPKVLWSIVSLGFLNVFLDTALSSSVIPILPKELKQDEFHEAIIIGSTAITATLLGPICGWLSDNRGWASILVWFYPLVFTSAMLMMSAKKSFSRFLIARFIAGAGSGVMYPSNFSMVVSTHDPGLRSSAVGFTLAGDIGSLCGPILAGYLYDAGGLSLTFSVLIALSFFAALVFFIVFPTVSSSTSFFDYFQPLFRNSNNNNNFNNNNFNNNITATSIQAQHRSGLSTASDLTQPFLYQQSRRGSTEGLASMTGKMVPETPSGVSTRDRDSDVPSFTFLSPRPFQSSSSFSIPFTHGSPPPPCIYNLHPQDRPTLTEIREQYERHRRESSLVTSSETYQSSGIFGKFKLMLYEFKVFATISFFSRCAALFYCWGLAVSLQAILPIIWDRQYNISPSSIGILFAPHLILRVSVSAFFPFFSDVTSTPLRTLISLGLLICTVAIGVLALVQSSVTTTVHSVIVAFLGLGLGLTDSCVTAWAGITDFESPLAPLAAFNNNNNNEGRQIQSSQIKETSEAYRGRAFALLALACDAGMFVVPLIASILSEYIAFSIAFGMLSIVGVITLSLSLYCGWIEARGQHCIQPSTVIHCEMDDEGRNSNYQHRRYSYASPASNRDEAPLIPAFITVG